MDEEEYTGKQNEAADNRNKELIKIELNYIDLKYLIDFESNITDWIYIYIPRELIQKRSIDYFKYYLGFDIIDNLQNPRIGIRFRKSKIKTYLNIFKLVNQITNLTFLYYLTILIFLIYNSIEQ